MEATFQALLFDIDGTLVDSSEAERRIWGAWAAQHELDAQRVLDESHGRRTGDVMAVFLPEEQVASAESDLEKLELADMDGVFALPGTVDLLPRLPSARWAAVTSGSRGLMRARLSAAGLPEPDVLIAAEHVSHGKPDPEGYLKAAQALGFDIEQCLVIEDSPAGVEAGRAAGATVLAVGTSHPADQLAAAQGFAPDLTACSFRETGAGITLSLP